VLVAALVLAGAGCGQTSTPPRQLAIAYSNDLRGEIRSCGCAVHDLGGLGRRATFLAALRDTTAGDVLLVDAGDFFGSGINYGVEKADVTLKSMSLMGYDGVVIGEDEFGFGLDFIVRRVRETRLPVLAANLVDAAADTLIFPASRIVTLKSGLRVGLVGVMSPAISMPPQVKAGSIEIREPLGAAQSAVDAMLEETDVIVVLAHMSRGEAQRFSQELAGVDVVLHGHEGKPMRQLRRFGDAYLLQLTARGLYMGVAYATFGPDGRIMSVTDAVTPMDGRFEDNEAVSRLFQAYDLDIAAKERATLPTGVTNTRNLAGDRFAGADACRECHEAIFDAWSDSPHAHAWETLTSQSRQFDRDCTPCHTVGFYKKGGFENIVATPHLTGVQCESCHGNGAAHVADPDVKTSAGARSLCQGCHTGDQSPDFDAEVFWKRIDHGPMGGTGAEGKGR
jgi:2',3'-cyclic-nucleotide 2'-phosphodiesterase (5'-nucleotidase family)